MDQSDQEMVSDDENHYADTNYDDTDDDSVDIITTDCGDGNFQKDESCSEGNNNKFSIDRILGLTKVDKRECDTSRDGESVRKKLTMKEVKCVKPTPISAVPRNAG